MSDHRSHPNKQPCPTAEEPEMPLINGRSVKMKCNPASWRCNFSRWRNNHSPSQHSKSETWQPTKLQKWLQRIRDALQRPTAEHAWRYQVLRAIRLRRALDNKPMPWLQDRHRESILLGGGDVHLASLHSIMCTLTIQSQTVAPLSSCSQEGAEGEGGGGAPDPPQRNIKNGGPHNGSWSSSWRGSR